MKADGSEEADILSIHPFEEGFPAWSPSGEFISFSSFRNDEILEVFLINSDGTGLTNLTNNPSGDGLSDWSPDSSQIVFVSERDGNNEIYTMNADGSEVTRLTDDPAQDEYPFWSPDGGLIVFNSDRDGDYEIFIMDTNGGNVTQITDNNANDGGPTWSPDGSKIAFVSDREGNKEIYTMNPDGSDVVRLTENTTDDIGVVWSPFGQMLAFASDRDGNYEIYIMMADGSDVRRLTNNDSSDSYPSWSPIGQTLSDEPWFGPPWCLRDTDGDFQPDTPTKTFTTDDLFSYIMFPFRNMEDGITWSHNWLPENGFSMNNLGSWDSGESGFHIAMFTAPSMGSGGMTIQLLIDGEVLQEIECEIVEP